MIIVISNRVINENHRNEYFFGETPNPQGADTIRIVKAYYQGHNNPWLIEPLPEDDNLNNEDSPSKQLFLEIIEGIENDNYKRKWIFYIPGFNQSSCDALDASQKLAEKYDAEVILFSWPSNPQGNSNSILELFKIESEYQEALSIAQSSAIALETALAALSQYIADYSFDDLPRRKIKFTLLIHSLGNCVLENCIKLSSSNVTAIFDNIILHQADVDNPEHEQWIQNIKPNNNVYVTINRDDYVLTASGAFHKSRLNSWNVNNRLGNNTQNFTAPIPVYYTDFTKGGQVANAHNLFFEVDHNAVVVNFFKQIFKGNSPLINNRPFRRSSSQENVYILDQDFNHSTSR